MAVYVDEARNEFRQTAWPYNRMVMSHMIADTEAELFDMAAKIDLAWTHVQRKDGRPPHFDVSQTKRQLAVAAGARVLNKRGFAEKLRELSK